MSKIKECPFCGFTGNRVISDQCGDPPHKEYWIMCENCGACGPNDLGESGAVEMWNLRRPMDTATDRAKAAPELLKLLKSVTATLAALNITMSMVARITNENWEPEAIDELVNEARAAIEQQKEKKPHQ